MKLCSMCSSQSTEVGAWGSSYVKSEDGMANTTWIGYGLSFSFRSCGYAFFWREHSQQNKLRRARKFSGETDAEGGGAGAENAGEGRFCLKDRYFWFASGWVG